MAPGCLRLPRMLDRLQRVFKRMLLILFNQLASVRIDGFHASPKQQKNRAFLRVSIKKGLLEESSLTNELFEGFLEFFCAFQSGVNLRDYRKIKCHILYSDCS